MHQELNNFAALKPANKKYAQDLAAAEESATVFQGTLEELHDLLNDKEALPEKAEVLTAGQSEAMAGMTEAGLKDKQSIEALEFHLSEAVIMHKQKQDTITEMQVVEYQLRDQVLILSRQAETDTEGLPDCWKKVCVKGGAAENCEKLWWRRRSIQSRKLEQAAQTQLQQELDVAMGAINRLQSEAHGTSMGDIYAGATPVGPLQPGLGSPSPGLLLSDIKSDDQAMPDAPSYSAVAAASALPADPAPVNAPQGSSEGSAGVELKEELLAH